MDVSFQTTAVVTVDVAALESLVLRAEFATVHHLRIQELPQPSPSPVALLNVTAWADNPTARRVGLCVMVVGLDGSGEILWACCLMTQLAAHEQWDMLESLLIAPQVLGQTRRVAMRVYGGQLQNDE